MTNEQIMQYDSYVYSIVMKYYNWYPNKEDLFQVGRIGLFTAYQNFDANQGAKFTTYAFFYIKGEMNRFIEQDKGIKVSRSIQKLKLLIEKTNILLSQQLMRNPTILELSNYLCIPEEQIVEAYQTIYQLQSMDEPICTDGKEVTLYDSVGDSSIDMDTRLLFKESLSQLSPYERQLLMKRYVEGKTQSEIAADMGINQVQVSRKVKKINDKIYQMVA